MYDPNEKVNEFIDNFGELGIHTIAAYNVVDPFSCFYGYDLNPDEYLGYAKRLMLQLFAGRGLYVAVVNSFHISQWENKDVTTEQAQEIASLISLWIDNKANLN